jgi:repressor LexA
MLNDRAREILAFIKRFSRDNGYPPTIREIGDAFAISSTNGVRYYLNLLEKSGHVKRTGKLSRGIFANADAPQRDAGIPVLGRVAAGSPILADESFEGSLEPARVFGDVDGLFALKVRGDSMVDAGILAGDYVVVRSQDRATSGEMIVALIGDEATVKYYRPRADRVELVPANETYQPIVVERGAAFRVLGIVKGVIRTVGRS